MRLVKGLYDRGLRKEYVRQLLRLIYQMMDLPKETEEPFALALSEFEKEKPMPYVTSFERLGIEKGRTQGRQEGLREGLLTGIEALLRSRFGERGVPLLAELSQVQDVGVL